jgi:ribonuclease P protein component
LSCYRFDSKRRLTTAEDYQYVFSKPVRSGDKYFTILARPSQQHQARLGLAVSKKNTRHAHDRNRLKRLARESFRLQHPSMQNIDYVVMARKGAAGADNSKLTHSLNKHWQKLEQLCASS